MNTLHRLAALAAAIGILSGCAVTSLTESAARAEQGFTGRTGLHTAWPPRPDPVAAPIPDKPLDVKTALAYAFAFNPDIRRLYARLGVAQADLQSAARISNPRLSFAWLDPSGGGRDDTTRGIAASFTDLLLLPSRRRLSTAELESTELSVSSALMTLAKEVEIAWFAAVGTEEAAKRRGAAAHTAETAAELAGRYREAGNLAQEQQDEERLRAADARVAALAAQTHAAEARARLAMLAGLSSADAWRLADVLPAPPEEPLAADGLAARATAQRFDLAAAGREVQAREGALATTKHWRLLGALDAGYEWERETDGEKRDGPTLAVELPLFDQGQGTVALADARLMDARARRDAVANAVVNEVTAGVARLELARGITEWHHGLRLPAAISAEARSRERVDFMLEGPFTLLHARAARLEAEAQWLESVRDYWIARATLRAAAGGALPGDDEERPPAMPPQETAPAPAGHEHHGDGT